MFVTPKVLLNIPFFIKLEVCRKGVEISSQSSSPSIHPVKLQSHLKKGLSPSCQGRCLREPLQKSAQKPEGMAFLRLPLGSDRVLALPFSHWSTLILRHILYIHGLICLAAITKPRRLDELNHRDLFSHSCGVWKSKFKGLAGLILLRPLLGLQRLSSVYTPLVSVWQNVLFLQGHLRLVRAHPDGLILTYLFKGPFSKYSHILRYCGLELQHMNFGRTPFNPYCFHL